MRRIVELGLQHADELLLFLRKRTAAVERAGLDGEALDDAVERHSVVDASLREAEEVADVFGRLHRIQLDGDRSHAGLEHGAVPREFLDCLG